MQRQLLCFLAGIPRRTLTDSAGTKQGRTRATSRASLMWDIRGECPTSVWDSAGRSPGVSPRPFPGPHVEPGRSTEPFSPGPVLFTARSASSPQGTETARPYETVAMNISPDLLTARALGLSGIHPLGNTTCNFRAAEIRAGWGCCPSLRRVRDAGIAVAASE